jgi:hypothetical protein
MPIIVLALGAMLIITAYNDTYAALFQQLGSDIPGFALWGAAILIIYFVSTIPGMDKPAKMFLGLLIVVFLLANQGVFANAQAALSGSTAPVQPQQVTEPSIVSGTPAPITMAGGSSSGGGGLLGGLTGGGGAGGALGSVASLGLGMFGL